MLRALLKLLLPDYHNSKVFHTVHFAFPLVFITALVAGFAAVITEESSFVSIKTDTTTVSQDQVFFITVNVTAHVPINAVDLIIEYPKSKIVVDNIDTGTSVITLWTEQPYAKDGSIYLRGGTFRKGFVGEHTIVRIKAHATEAGEARISVKNTEFIAGDGLGTTIPSSDSDGKDIAKIYVSGDDGVISGQIEITFITDIDGDGKVDLKDISAFMAAWFTKNKVFDFNGDGEMTFRDFSILLADSIFN